MIPSPKYNRVIEVKYIPNWIILQLVKKVKHTIIENEELIEWYVLSFTGPYWSILLYYNNVIDKSCLWKIWLLLDPQFVMVYS